MVTNGDTTVARVDGPRRRGPRLIWQVAIVLVLLLVGLIGIGRTYWRSVTTEVEDGLGLLRDHTTHWVLGRAVGTTTGPARESTVTAFLRTHPPSQQGRWHFCKTEYYDWRGRLLGRTFHGERAWMLEDGSSCRAENLWLVAKWVPDLADRIRREILPPWAGGAYVTMLLNAMCSDPTSENIRHQLEEWERVREEPWIYAPA